MEARLAVAFARRVDEKVSVTRLCEELGISRQTYYVYVGRYQQEGLVGLVARSRAAKQHPNQSPVEVEDLVVAKRCVLIEQGLDAGAASVWGWLTRAGVAVPSARTIHRIFVRRGVVTAQPKKRPHRTRRRSEAKAPNGCWQLDGMDWRLADGTAVKVIRAIDDHARKVFRSVVAASESGQAAWDCLAAAIAKFGPPAMLLSDNSLAFNGSRRGVDVALQKRLRALGVAQVAASYYHPQTCGKAEREHQTLQKWLLAHPAATTIAELQALIDIYDDIYNTQRPHQALGGLSTPDERYAATAKAVPAQTPLPEPDQRLRQVTVSTRGTVSAGSNDTGRHIEVQIGREWEHSVVTVARHGNHVAVFHHGQLIASTHINPTRRYQPSGKPSGRPKGGAPRPRITRHPAEPPRDGAARQDGQATPARPAAHTGPPRLQSQGRPPAVAKRSRSDP